MNTHIHKYKLTFFSLFLLISGLAKGQQNIESLEYTLHKEEYIFACGKAASIDLFKAAQLYVSPENGYWGDVRGVPYDGKVGTADAIKERQYTTGSIFTPSTAVADTGMYKFYFYFTSPKGYCGITNNTRFILNLYIGTYGCEIKPIVPISGELYMTHTFCFGNSTDFYNNKTRSEKYKYTEPITLADLLFTNTDKPYQWRKDTLDNNSAWLDLEVFSDREYKNPINHQKVDLRTSYDSMYYVVIRRDDYIVHSDSIHVKVFPDSELALTYAITYTPNIKQTNKDFDIDEKITIKVDTTMFNYFNFMLNNKSLSKYYLGGDSTRNEITLSPLAFYGLDDFIEVIATDTNNCVVRHIDNVFVNVPLPTVFTPDGDGINDIFFGGEKFRNREFHLEVSNRWGSLLYSGESGWDGTYRGNKVPPGTYLYVIILKTDDGSTRTVKGVVSLVRENR
jgi:gliding motility-associated-like protein